MGRFIRAVVSFLNTLDGKPSDETSLDDELLFLWSDFPDPLRPDKRVHVCDLPGGSTIMVQEVSAPEPDVGHIGWQLLDNSGAPVEMRNGFFEVDKAKTHAEDHFRKAYIGQR